MRQKQAETKIIEALNNREVIGIYNTACEHEEVRPLLLEAIQRVSGGVPKFQIIIYLNRYKNFKYEAQDVSQD